MNSDFFYQLLHDERANAMRAAAARDRLARQNMAAAVGARRSRPTPAWRVRLVRVTDRRRRHTV